MILKLRTTFRIAHGASDERRNVLVRLQMGELTGLGEAAAVPQYHDTQESLTAYLESVAPILEAADFDDPFFLDDILALLPPGPQAARAAVDIALHDLWGQRLGQPLYRLFGLNPGRAPDTSFTIAIDTPEVMAERAVASGFPILKIKLGSPDDEAIIAAVRRACDEDGRHVRLCADANAGWTVEQALDLIPRLAKYDLEMIEQPLPADDIEGLRRLHAQNFGLPIYADESARTSQEVAALAGVVDGIVVKLMKTGGLREALRTIHTARAHGMGLMLSCMVESSVGVSAAAHLAPLCDFADLDGPLLVRNDPYLGVQYAGARLLLPDRPGLGLQPR